MKRLLLVVLILFAYTASAYSQSVTIGEDGIVRCLDVPIGTVQEVDGDEYLVVDRTLLNYRRSAGADLTKVCVSNVTDMGSLFEFTPSFNQPITNWDVSNVVNMSRMFQNSQFNQPIGNWDVSSVKAMYMMFYRSSFNQPLDNWDVSNVEIMSFLFNFTSFNHSIENWDVSSVINMSNMFQDSDFNQPLENWDVSNVQVMDAMFSRTQFNQPLNNWDVSKVTSMIEMFHESTFNQPLDNWDVSSVTNMGGLFSQSKFNQPISDWDVSNVTNMAVMFRSSPFNQSIESWNVSKVRNMTSMFLSTHFNQSLEDWDVSNVTTMSNMFYSSEFNKPIQSWDVSSVTNMSDMFRSSHFNQPLDDWDLRNVTDMTNMFHSSRFNQPINYWCVPKINTEPISFNYRSSLTNENMPVWGMCLGLPPKPTLLYPSHSEVDVSRTTELTWAADTTSTKYRLQVYVGYGLEPMVIDTTISETTYKISVPLEGDITYLWRVKGINGDRIFRGELYKGVWSEYRSFKTVVGTSIEAEEIPTQFVLNQNYPNPFNPTTQIQFSLPNATHVRLEVYSVLGQRVGLLLNEERSAGLYNVPFNGSALSSGIYIYRLTTPEFTQSKMMNLIK
ncbi:MAG: BspA family leucine-rich repeat surface protein [Balneolales bacterium]|nr:BspA family leucine-rich repeat surface protein [Balneolales bacterium]